MIVTPAEMRRLEDAAFKWGVTAEALVDAVGQKIAERLIDFAARDRVTFIFCAGKGNNAADVLVAAKALRKLAADSVAKVRICVRLAFDDPARLGDLTRTRLADLAAAEVAIISAQQLETLSARAGSLVVVDGLLGIGASGKLRDPIKTMAREINALRHRRDAYVISVDVPTGLDAETGEADADAVVADETLTIGFAKTGLLTDEAANHVGKLQVIPIAEFERNALSGSEPAARGTAVTPEVVGALLPPRPHESNKGMFGRIGILAGSVGATGAAVMCSHACARAGGGLITLLTHPDIYPTVAGAASPEVMVKPLPSILDVLDMDFDVVGIGPGLGRALATEVRELVVRWPRPMVVDADGLNALAEDTSALARPAGPRLLTPHPGEMKRLLDGCDSLHALSKQPHPTRAAIARAFTDRFPVTLLLKGARTVIAQHALPLAYNTTGNAGMATGGMGDVLTGICCALAGQKLALYDAACAGAWLHGRAADLAREDGQSEQSLLPLDLLSYLGRAFTSARSG